MLKNLVHSKPVRIVALCCALSSSGCQTPGFLSRIEIPKLTPFDQEEGKINVAMLRRTHNAAADALFQGAHAHLNTLHKVHMVELNNLGEPLVEGKAAITWLVPQQVGNRLAQLGLNVEQPQTVPAATTKNKGEAGTLPLQLTKSPAVKAPEKRKAGIIYLEGDYAYLEETLLVSLRLIDGRTNRILSTTEYDMVVDTNLYPLIDPRATDRIFGSAWMQ